jgi:phospholipase C
MLVAVPLVLTPWAGAGPTAARPAAIQHVVVLYLENHSFDSILGFWCDQNPGRCPDGGMPSSVVLSDGTVVRPSVSPDTVPPVNHLVAAQKAAMNIVHGVPLMNGWQKIPASPKPQDGCGAAQNYDCISGYEPGQIPNLTNLAKNFAISDRTFSMADSPSWGGHIYAVAASTDGFTGDNPTPKTGVTPGQGWGCDSNLVTPWAPPGGTITHKIPSCVPDPSLTGHGGAPLPNGGAFEPTPAVQVPTIMDGLNAAGLSWKIYGAACLTETVNAAGLQTCTKGQGGYIWSICPTFAECLYSRQDGRLVPDSQFLTDAAAGTLPSFSVVTPGGPDYSNGCHNNMSITACDNWIGSLVRAVMNGPSWSSTAIFITFDDCGCFYDQVPPGTNPDGTQQGPRVPLIIVSPYARHGYTDTSAATFTSILAYTEHIFGLTPLGVNDARAYGFAKAFNYAQAPLKPVRMVTRPLPPSARRIRLTPAMLNDPS